MTQLLRELRKRAYIGFVSGSDIVKVSEQLDVPGEPGTKSLP
jgi:hypothetical protein